MLECRSGLTDPVPNFHVHPLAALWTARTTIQALRTMKANLEVLMLRFAELARIISAYFAKRFQGQQSLFRLLSVGSFSPCLEQCI